MIEAVQRASGAESRVDTGVEIVSAPAVTDVSNGRWQAVGGLRVPVTVELPLRAFRVRDLLALDAGTVLRSVCRSTDAVPLRAREQTLAMVEFEVADGMLYARVAEIA